MGRRKSLTGPLTERIAALLAPLGDPARIALLQAMREGGEVNIQELADEVDIPHRIASHHLTVLHRAGLIVRRREGRQVFYAVEDWSAWWLIEQAASVFDDSDALN
jgi:DNA-binding transcriptional ArsR family regulator